QELSYRQLNSRANQLARLLIRSGLGPERIVALCLPRSTDYFVALLAVLKAGAAYLPLDPSYPHQRLSWMLADSRASLILTLDEISRGLPPVPASLFCLDREWERVAALPDDNPALTLEPESLAYLIYTSGSTGRPKGVMVSHRNLAHSTCARLEYYQQPPERYLLVSPFPFDSSVAGIYWTLATGGGLVLPADDYRQDLRGLLRLIESEGVTHLLCLPSLAQVLVEESEAGGAAGLRTLIVAGESCPRVLIERVREKWPWVAVYNEYGPTEGTVWATVSECGERLESGVVAPIGKPINRARVYVLDRHGEPAAVGAVGEIYIGGEGVARGYYGGAEMTAERFIPDGYSGEEGRRLYRTGDLGRWREGGELEYVGRGDEQVKVRGYRVELGEVEGVMREHPGVKEVAVVARGVERGEARLEAYVVRGGEEVSVKELREWILSKAPEYMAPASYVWVDRMPEMANGKVDRRALAEMEVKRFEMRQEYAPPRTELEAIFAAIWSEVLGINQVGIYDNFFELGGDSIRSIQILSRARQKGIEFSLHLFNSHPTIHGLIQQVKVMEKPVEGVSARVPFSLITSEDRRKLPEGVTDAYPLARLQAGMLFHSEYNADSMAYLDIASFHLRAPFDADAMRQALAQLAARHPALRTSFDLTGFSESLQLVHETVEIPCQVDDLRRLQVEDQELLLDKWLDLERGRKFDLERAPLLRFHFHRRSDQSFQITYACHHAILDGWSAAYMLTELFQCYLRLLGQETAPLPPPPSATFAAFVALERETERSEASRCYWLEKLDGFTVTKLPRSPRREANAQDVNVCEFDLSPEISDGLKRFSQSSGIPLRSVLLSAHLQVLSAISGERDVVTGVVSHGRPEEADGERVLGLFLNTLPFRFQMGQGAWIDLARDCFEAENQTHDHRRYPVAELQKAFGGKPLFETAFNFVHFHVYQSVLKFKGVEVLGSKFFQKTNLALITTFHHVPSSEAVQLHIEYDGAEFSDEQIATIAETYVHILASMAADPATRYDRVSLMTARRQKVLSEWNETSADFPRDARIHELFEKQVAKAPEKIALIEGGTRLSYRDLNNCANQLAHYLKNLGIGAEDRVGLCVERSVDLAIGMLGIMKAGGAYLPLDPSTPVARLTQILKNAQAQTVITQRLLSDKLATTGTRLICLDDASDASRQSAENPVCQTMGENLAYVIYTSGSTGEPKGVMISQRSVVNHALAVIQYYGLSDDDRVLQFASGGFDVAAEEVFPTLLCGSNLVIPSSWALASFAEFQKFIAEQRLTVLNLPSPYWHEWVTYLAQTRSSLPASLRLVVVGSEKVFTGRYEIWKEVAGEHIRLINAYGLTEATITSTCYEPSNGEPQYLPRTMPIGKPLRNIRAHILDRFLRPAPIGAPGELYLAGEGVARGYLGRPDLTAERFLPDPSGRDPGDRIYKTGDAARWLNDGAIEFLGRLDNQVKFRGFRIELGEIEAALLTHPQVSDAAVIMSRDDQTRIVAYIVAAPEAAPAHGELRDCLANKLPDYMIPAVFVTLDALPLTPNGKLDRLALPSPDPASNWRQDAFVPPGDEIELLLAEIWRQTLRVTQLSVHDNFFELGGDSIISLQIVARANQAGLGLSPEQLFQHPTIAELARVVKRGHGSSAEQGMVTGPVPLTPIQRIFFEQTLIDPHHWNQSALLETQPDLDLALLRQAIDCLLRHHDALRLRYVKEGQSWIQFHAIPDESIPLLCLDFASLPDDQRKAAIETKAEELQSGLNLSEGPLMRMAYFDLGTGRPGRLLIVAHHLLVDGVSWRILLEDLQTAYRRLSRGETVQLPPKKTSFKRWAERLERLAISEEIRGEADFWLSKKRERAPRLPLDRPEGVSSNTVGSARGLSVSLNETETRALLYDLPKAYRTQINDVLLTALTQAFTKWMKTDSILVDVEGHGRNAMWEEVNVSRTVGWFTTVFPVLLELRHTGSVVDALKQVKEQLRAIPNHGMGYGLLRHMEGNEDIAQKLRGLPEAEVSFNYLGQFDQAFEGDPIFKLAGESSGPEHSPRGFRQYLLEINAGVYEGEFRAVWTYSSNIHHAETISDVAEGFISALRAVLDHRRSTDAGGYTPADFPLVGLNQRQLDQIVERLGRDGGKSSR
ncbi:MAG: amino acid adenylation domain-containing protein, partial [Acidobacteria bacterium]|nr:amino acid adenylation domain-containing protein [Acidobacteriota bacterium]